MDGQNVTPRTCPTCGAAIVRRTDEDSGNFRRRRSCGYRCAMIERHRARSAALGDIRRERRIAKFNANIDRSAGPDGCWNWTAGLTSRGYGQFVILGKKVIPHRLALELSGVIVPSEMFVCHRCDNRRCCNPSHLFIGTNADNMADKIAKGRQSRGEGSGVAKITAACVVEIRRRYEAGMSQDEIASMFGISQSNVSVIVQRKAWAHI